MADLAAAELTSLKGRVALVSGGGGAIGACIAQLFLDAGARVACVDLPGREGPQGCLTLHADLGRAAEVERLAQEVEETFGRLDILVHAAGIVRDAVSWKLDPRDWRAVLEANLDSAFHLLHFLTPLLRQEPGAAVVLVGSINGERGKFGQASYAASKAGLIGLGRSAARELGRFQVRVNILSPGLVETPMTAGLDERVLEVALSETVLGHFAQPADVARVAWFLCSDLSRHVTGQVLRVDGGQLMA